METKLTDAEVVVLAQAFGGLCTEAGSGEDGAAERLEDLGYLKIVSLGERQNDWRLSRRGLDELSRRGLI